MHGTTKCFAFFLLVSSFLGAGTTNTFCECEQRDFLHSCECSGKAFDEVPTNLVGGFVSRLSLTRGNITEILPGSLGNYTDHLTDLSISIMHSLRKIHPGVFRDLPHLKYLKVVHTGIVNLPQLRGLGEKTPLSIIDFENNKISSIEPHTVLVRTEQFFLNYNEIQYIEGWAFNGSEIAKLSFHGNRQLRQLSPHAFGGIKSLRELDLSDTSIISLPAAGLGELEVLKLTNTYSLKTIPSIYDLKKLQIASLTYSFHCCAFHYPQLHNPARHQEYLNEVKRKCGRDKRSIDEGFGDIVDQDPSIPFNDTSLHGHFRDEVDSDGSDFSMGVFHEYTIETFKIEAVCGNLTKRPPVKCWPKQDELNPCEDMMSWVWLRVSVWIVLLPAIVGNTSVLFVLSFSRSETTVPKFLMLHLAFADLCMAIYLLLLASMDVASSNSYFNFAFDWQNGAGCKVAGFLTVFASQLSLFTLCLLTLERWFAIKHALYSNRLDHRLARRIIIIGWIYSIAMASLPLFGVSSYSRTSICLPMDTQDMKSLAYVLLLLVTATISFLLICICYTQIYMSLDYETRVSREGAVAKKLTILVGTNFVCWAPIAFFALTALLGHPLINVSQSKILLVFIYPINSCANPYLYAILTKQFRKDLVTLLKRYGFCTQCNKYKSVHSSPNTNEIQHVTAETGV